MPYYIALWSSWTMVSIRIFLFLVAKLLYNSLYLFTGFVIFIAKSLFQFFVMTTEHLLYNSICLFAHFMIFFSFAAYRICHPCSYNQWFQNQRNRMFKTNWMHSVLCLTISEIIATHKQLLKNKLKLIYLNNKLIFSVKIP